MSEELVSAADLNVDELVKFGRILDRRPRSLCGRTVLAALAEQLLMVRTREGWTRQLRANAVQRAFERRRGQQNIVLKARQMGLTTWVAARFLVRTMTLPGTMTLEVAHTQDAAEEIFRIVHRFVDWLPEELRMGALRTSRSNARQIVFPEIDATYCVVTAGDRNAGRGMTVQNLHCSEVARWPGDARETMAGLRAGLAPGAELVMESTPNGVGGCFYEEWQRAEEAGVVRHFFPWWMEESYRGEEVEMLTEEERALSERNGLTRAQIGYRRQMRQSMRGLAAQEFAEDAESCFLSSGDAVFEMSAIEKRLSELPEPGAERWNGQMQVWLPTMAGRRYLVAVDPAGGGSEGDLSAVEIVDMETGAQCAEFAGHVGGLELAERVVELAKEYNDAWLVVERNNHGTGVLALAETVCGYERIYRQNGQPGWLTTTLTRPQMLASLDAALVDEPGRFMSGRLLAECRSFVRGAHGRTEARTGTHDDRVMAMALAVTVRAELITGSRNRGGVQRKWA